MKSLIFLAICSFLLTLSGAPPLAAAQGSPLSRKDPARPLLEKLQKQVPEFARAAAWLNGEKLLADPQNFALFRDIIPGLREKNFSRDDLAHFYLFFASEDLKVYGTVIGKGKGTLTKLHALFSNTASVVKLSPPAPDSLLVIWGKEPTAALGLKGKKEVLKLLNEKAVISSAALMQITRLPGNAPKKLLKEFPELKHLQKVELEVANTDRKTSIGLFFNNEKSPRKGFSFLNWGLTLLLWHKTGALRHFRQDVEKNQLLLTVIDPPLGKIAQKLLTPSQKKSKVLSTQERMKLLALGLHLYAADHSGRLPAGLKELYKSYLQTFLLFTAPYDKEASEKKWSPSFLFLLPGADLKTLSSPSKTPMLSEDPSLMPPKLRSQFVIFADGKLRKNKRIQSSDTQNTKKLPLQFKL